MKKFTHIILPIIPSLISTWLVGPIILCLRPAGFSFSLSLDPEDGSDMFLRNIGCLSTDYLAFFSQKVEL
jgi:hypothetical protein